MLQSPTSSKPSTPSRSSTSASREKESLKKRSLRKERKKMEKGAEMKGKRTRKKKRQARQMEHYAAHISRVMKQIHSKTEISTGGMAIMNSFVNDLFHRIAGEASHLVHYSNRSTIGEREIQTAVRLILPGDLAKYAIVEGNKAIKRFMTSK
ncbi:unnamed protein product [Litomosoides sigmodontis]|uniref:Core Histone H2A/H2B/H3 domain-containing protein n=1 Tax=Litomosoides sigmodontis TaxID=42156 RepID=A0A3P7JLU1_LITSI|nr:unnamed protein product [Litomosoides sigmodontis]